jgi:NAD(P)-dependent dehydrogenase (short-subunit alcohol dehydrogenase family)
MTTNGQVQAEGPGQARPQGLGKVSDRVALVTGGTRGIGAAICRQLADAGAEIAAGYWRDHEAAEKFVASMTAEYPGQRITVHEGNIGAAGDCRRVLGEVIDQHGRLDVLVNNAGITIDRTVAKMTDEDWQKVIAVNLSGAFFMAQAALEHMLERGTGRVISMSSAIGETGSIGQANYAASKSGQFGLTMSLALESANKGITVNCVAPGFVETEMTAAVPPEIMERVIEQIPARRLGRPEEIARVVLFIAEPDSSYITGQVYSINGGLNM